MHRLLLLATSLSFTLGCIVQVDDVSTTVSSLTSETSSASESSSTNGDGDGDGAPGDGDGTPGDGDGAPGDGDGTPGDGDGTPGDGDGAPGDGDGAPNPGNPYDAAAQHCVDVINMYRATLNVPPLQRWTDAEACTNSEAESDAMTNTPHGAFGMCGEWGQNECPGWPGPPDQLLDGCLAQMWAEGPGADFNLHGHYLNMSNPDFTKVSCGFYQTNQGDYWAAQNFQ